VLCYWLSDQFSGFYSIFATLVYGENKPCCSRTNPDTRVPARIESLSPTSTCTLGAQFRTRSDMGKGRGQTFFLGESVRGKDRLIRSRLARTWVLRDCQNSNSPALQAGNRFCESLYAREYNLLLKKRGEKALRALSEINKKERKKH